MPPPEEDHVAGDGSRLAALRSSRRTAVALVTFVAFIDLVAYSIVVPILPDMSGRLGASPTTIGFLFASFGATLLLVSVPMGAVSDRVGRKGPLVAGLIALAASTVLFAFAERLSWLFAARLIQGAADAVTWVVGFALIADLYGPAERGRAMGLVMAGTSFGLMVGPTLGGWLYETGGVHLPFFTVAAGAIAAAAALLWLRPPPVHVDHEALPIRLLARERAVVLCVLVVAAGASTIAMLEPVLALWLAAGVGLGPARIGLVFGIGAVASTLLHPLYGRLADSWGGRPMTALGLMLTAAVLPLLNLSVGFESAAALYALQAAAIALVVTPSLAYMAEAVSRAGGGSFGAAFGLYNFAWGAGLLLGPAMGGFLYEHLGFRHLTYAWAPAMLAVGLWFAAGQWPARAGARATLPR
jgi:MFS transporter, DHA1 family, solute carrier family 18 (vesicular amine transporter), member 1/2